MGLSAKFFFILVLSESEDAGYAALVGGVAEWLNAPVLKTDVGESLPWVRIPPPPPENLFYWFHSIPKNNK